MRKLAQFTFAILTFALVSLVASAPVQAQTLTDPADLFIGNPGSCPDSTSCPFLFGGTEVIGVNGGSVDMVLNGQSASTTVGQLILIVAIPNFSGTAPSINGLNGSPVSILASGPTSLTLGEKAYGQLGLNGDGSESFANFSAADLSVLGITATSFGLYEYILPTSAMLSGKGTPLTLTFAGSGLPVGTFVFGWGCETALPCDVGNTFSTPFTQTGLVVSTPEPSAVEFLGLSLLLIGGAAKWGTKSA